jgi:hypothetical protein
VLGHTHKPYVRDVGGTRFVSPGPWACPMNNPPRSACLAGTGRPTFCIWTKRRPRNEKRLPTGPKPMAVSKLLSWQVTEADGRFSEPRLRTRCPKRQGTR